MSATMITRGGRQSPPSPATYGPCPTRGRRTGAEFATLRERLSVLLAAEHPMTVRQVFYQLVHRGLIAKTEGEYKRTVGQLLLDMRLKGEILFGWIADGTRWMRVAGRSEQAYWHPLADLDEADDEPLHAEGVR